MRSWLASGASLLFMVAAAWAGTGMNALGRYTQREALACALDGLPHAPDASRRTSLPAIAPPLYQDSTKTCVSALAPTLCSEPPPSYPQWPVHYLVGVYARAAGVHTLAG